MKELLEKAKINETKLKQIISRTVAQELGKLAEPCYYPSVKGVYYEFLKYTNLTEEDLKAFTKRTWSGRKEAKFSLHNDKVAMMYVFLLHYFLRKNDVRSYLTMMVLYVIRHYANLLKKQLKFCDVGVFNYTFQVLTKTHLFHREKTIANALYFIAKAMANRWKQGLKNWDLDKVSLFIQDTRSRISQSVKSFVNTYMKASAQGKSISAEELPSDEEGKPSEIQTPDKTNRLVAEIARKITVYKFIDNKARDEARKRSKINVGTAQTIIQGLTDVGLQDNIRTVLQLFIREVTKVSEICGEDFYKRVDNLMSIKRTTAKIYFKQQVEVLLNGVLKKTEEKPRYDKLTSQTKFLIQKFLAYYITLVLRNQIC
jgi:hypothetical protein